jgi:hypothetical protein
MRYIEDKGDTLRYLRMPLYLIKNRLNNKTRLDGGFGR